MISQMTDIPVDLELYVVKAVVSETGKKGDWIVEGYAATSDPDTVGDIISPEALRQAVKDVLERTTVLHNHHLDEEVGVVLKAKSDAKGLWVRILISKTVPDIWKKIQEGVLNKFSFRAKIIDAVKRYDTKLRQIVNYVKAMKVIEVSVVSVPVNAKAKSLKNYVVKAMEDFEVKEKGTISKDPLDRFLDQMEDAGHLKKSAEAIAADEAEEKVKAEAEEKVKAEAEEKVKAEAEEKVKAEAEEKVKAEAKAAAEKAVADEKAKGEKKTAKEELKDSLTELMRGIVKTELETVIAEMRKDAVSAVDEIKKSIGEDSKDNECRMKSLEDRLQKIDKITTERKSITADGGGDKEGDFWKGTTPF